MGRFFFLASVMAAAGCAVDPGGLPAPDGSVATDCSNDDECSDGVDCTDDICGPDGTCTFPELDSRCADGEVCIGGIGCQPESACDAEECEATLRVALTCQIGACQPDGTCVGESVCGEGESCCGDGTCQDCDDGNPCTADSCDASAGGCVHEPLDGTACDDGDFCTGTEVCVAGTCESSGDPCIGDTVCEVDRCVGCVTDGDCPGDIVPPYGACDWSDTCDQTATRSRIVTSFECSASQECVGTDREEIDNCNRNTTGTMCAPDMVTPWSACGGYSGTCDETGTQSRQRTTFACESGTCNDSVATETQACMRDTDGITCMDTFRPPWGPCGEFDDACDEEGVEQRTITVYECASGSCAGMDMPRSQSCSRETDGTTGCGTPMPDVPTGPCTQDNPGTCDTAGTEPIMTYSTMCVDGGCVQVPAMSSRSCVVPTDGFTCGGTGPCAGECNGGTCDLDANNGATCGGTGPCAGECNGGSCDTNANDGASCGGTAECPGECSGGMCNLDANNGDTCGGTGPCAGECDGGSCDANANDGATCDDGISCTGDGMCSGGTCSMGTDTCTGGDCTGCGGSECACRDVSGTFECACP